MKLHLYPIGDGFFVEDEDFRLLAFAGGMWGFTEDVDSAYVFATETGASEMASRWES